MKKKAVLYTLATTIASSTVSAMSVEEVKAIENNLSNLNESENVEVKIENTEKIENVTTDEKLQEETKEENLTNSNEDIQVEAEQ